LSFEQEKESEIDIDLDLDSIEIEGMLQEMEEQLDYDETQIAYLKYKLQGNSKDGGVQQSSTTSTSQLVSTAEMPA